MAGLAFLRPGELGYDEARRVWNAMVDRRPELIARCRGTADVVTAIARAQRDGLEIGVRCGGLREGGPAADGGDAGAVGRDPRTTGAGPPDR